MTRARNRAEAILLPALVAGASLLVWSLAVRWTRTQVFPSPLAVVRGMAELARTGLLLRYLGDSLFRVAAGFLLSLAVGVPLGMWMGLSPVVATVMNPVIQFLRPISPLAWIPLSILFFGISNLATVFLIFLASSFPVTVATMNAAREVPLIYVRAGHNFGLSRAALLRRIIFPAALPRVLNGLRISLGVSWLVLVAAEMIAVDSGLGYLILDARNAGKRYDLVMGGMVLIGLVGLMLDVGARWIETLPSVRWGFRKD